MSAPPAAATESPAPARADCPPFPPTVLETPGVLTPPAPPEPTVIDSAELGVTAAVLVTTAPAPPPPPPPDDWKSEPYQPAPPPPPAPTTKYWT